MTIISNFTEEHLEKTFIWMQDQSLKNSFLLRKDITRDAHLTWFGNICNDSTQVIMSIIYNGVHCGNCGLKYIDLLNKKAELWIYLGEKEFRGKGIAQDAVNLLLKHSLDKLNLHKIYLHVTDFNENAIHVYKKCGFIEEGFLVDEIFYNNQYISLYRMRFINK